MSDEARRALRELRGELPLVDLLSPPSLAEEQDDYTKLNLVSSIRYVDKAGASSGSGVENTNILSGDMDEETVFEDDDSEFITIRQVESAVGTDRKDNTALVTDRQYDMCTEGRDYDTSITERQDCDEITTERQGNQLQSSHASYSKEDNWIELDDLRGAMIQAESKQRISKTTRSRGLLSVRTLTSTYPGASRSQRRHEVLKDDLLDTDRKRSYRSFDKFTILPSLYFEHEAAALTKPSECTRTYAVSSLQIVDKQTMDLTKDVIGDFQTKQTVDYTLDTGYNSMISNVSKMQVKQKFISLDRVIAARKSNRCDDDNEDVNYIKTSTTVVRKQSGLLTNRTGATDDCHKQRTAVINKHKTKYSRASSNDSTEQILHKYTKTSQSPHYIYGKTSVAPSPRRGESFDILDIPRVSVTTVAAAAVISRATDVTAQAVIEQNRMRDLALLKFQQQSKR